MISIGSSIVGFPALQISEALKRSPLNFLEFHFLRSVRLGGGRVQPVFTLKEMKQWSDSDSISPLTRQSSICCKRSGETHVRLMIDSPCERTQVGEWPSFAIWRSRSAAYLIHTHLNKMDVLNDLIGQWWICLEQCFWLRTYQSRCGSKGCKYSSVCAESLGSERH